MTFTLNFHEFLHTVYTCAKFSYKNSLMFAQYFEYYGIILGGVFCGHCMWASIEILTVHLVVLNQFVNVSDKQLRCHTIHGIHVMLLGSYSSSWVVSHYIISLMFLVAVRVGNWFKKTALNIDHRTM